MAKDPLIVLIGGCAGTGKSTLSKNLSERLNIIHRVGTGFIREVIRAHIKMEEHPYMFGFTFQPAKGETPIQKFQKQSEFMSKAIKACIDRSYNEGTPLVIEGAHIIPGLIQDKKVALTILLHNPDFDNHHDMIHGPTHFKRVISDSDFETNRQIQEWLLQQAKENNVPVITNDTEENVLTKTVELINGK